MELIDRYLQSIRTFLTGKDRDDILHELRESLLSQIEDREHPLGRPLTEDELVEMLRKNGPPFVVAASYGPHRSLIGPTLFPFYWQALKWGLTLALIIRLIVAALKVLVSPHTAGETVHELLAVPGVVLQVFAWTTAAFAGLEWALSVTSLKGKSFSWNPRVLPKLRRDSAVVPRHESAAAVIFGLVGIAWLRAVAHAPFLVLGPMAAYLAPAPIWAVMYNPILALAAASVVQAMVMLLRPYWSEFNTWSRVTINAATFLVFCVLFRAGVWVVVMDSVPSKPHLESLAAIVNQALYYWFAVSLVVLPLFFAWDLYKRLRKKSAAARASSNVVTASPNRA
jgi:hypothetical protein